MNPMENPHFFIIGAGGGPGKQWSPPWNDPSKFPRSERVTDDECIERMMQIERFLERSKELRDKIVEIQEELNILSADMDGQKARLFPKLRKLYPTTYQEGGYYGWRKWESQYYAVGWDDETIAKYMKEHGHGRTEDEEPNG